MPAANELIVPGKERETWTKYCGFLDLSLNDYMKIQERLLLEQVQLLGASGIGRYLFGHSLPKTVDEFRRNVPLTNYEDYAPFLEYKREDVLPEQTYHWAYTSGRTSLSGHKWVPIPQRMYERLGEAIIGAMLLASCSKKGEIRLEQEDFVLLATAPPPYISGLLSHSIAEQISIQFLPSLEEGEGMPFEERVNKGFSLAKEFGLDYFFGLASILAKIGEMFEHGSRSGISLKNLNPKILPRLLRGWLKSKIKRRNLFPKDIWKLKGIITTGTDTQVFCNKVERYWGRKPLEGYICTEGGAMATQAWTYNGLNFYPDTNFIEFIPYDEHLKNKLDRNYRPSSLLMDEVRQGIYELVFTNLLGGVFTRYRIGDLFEVTSMRDEEADIDLPQMRLYSRTDAIIDLGAIARITEVQISQSIEATQLRYKDWVARKENSNGDVFLHIYIELKEQKEFSNESLHGLIRDGLLKHVPEFPNLEELLGNNHLRISRLAAGSWDYYKDFQKKVGADLAHLKPQRIQPSDAVMRILLEKTRRE